MSSGMRSAKDLKNIVTQIRFGQSNTNANIFASNTSNPSVIPENQEYGTTKPLFNKKVSK